jgi:hypothetical protein
MSISPQNPLSSIPGAITAGAQYKLEQKMNTQTLENMRKQGAIYDWQEKSAHEKWLQDNNETVASTASLPFDIAARRMLADKTGADINYTNSAAAAQRAQAAITAAELPGARFEAGKYKAMEGFGDLFPKKLNWLKYAPGVAHDLIGDAIGSTAKAYGVGFANRFKNFKAPSNRMNDPLGVGYWSTKGE